MRGLVSPHCKEDAVVGCARTAVFHLVLYRVRGVMNLPHAAFQVLSPDTDRRKDAHLLGPSRGAGTFRCCLLQPAPPCLQPLGSQLPGNQQLKTQPFKCLSALPALVRLPCALPLLTGRTGATPSLAFKQSYTTAAWGEELGQCAETQPGPRSEVSKEWACGTSLLEPSTLF